jgi:hypothetical protein
MMSFHSQYFEEIGERAPQYAPDFDSVVLSYVSHVYQDVFNNPMQAFLPRSVYPCGKWEFWAELDFVNFRTTLYADENIRAFRSEMYSAALWQRKLRLPPLLRAMLSRTAATSIVSIPQSLVNEAYEALGVRGDVSSSELSECEEFLVAHENLMMLLIKKYSRHPLRGSPNAVFPAGS